VQGEKTQFQVSEMRNGREHLTLWGKFRIQRLYQKKKTYLRLCSGFDKLRWCSMWEESISVVLPSVYSSSFVGVFQ